ncbi:efflux RND transporter periplasmic adaptor subunit [Candidatus Uhrbacteria bacterium]|nr:efflux RND transporter periplasmic adaptor subunit [Candidatus Uhrbacteria bacterium]
MPKMGKKGIVAIVVTAVVLVTLAVRGVMDSDVAYETAVIDRGTVVERISVTGSVAPKTRIDLQAEVSAKVTGISAAEGDVVEEGDLLVSLDSRDLSARIAGQSAAVEAAEALLAQYRAGATPEELRVSATAVDSARSRYEAAVMAQADAERSLANARSSRDTAILKVPINLQTKADTLTQAYDAALTASRDAVDRLTAVMFDGSDFLTFTVSDFQSETDAVNTRREARSAISRLESAILSVRATGTAESASASYSSVVSDLQSVKRHADACALALNYASGLSSSTLASYQLNVSTAQSSMNSNMQSVTSANNALDLQRQVNDADMTAADSAVSGAEASLNSATSAVTAAERSLAQAQADYEYRQAGVRPEQIDAQAARVRAERAGLSSLYADLAKRSVRAPVDGLVTEINVEVGESVQVGKTVAVMNTDGNFDIVANISEVDIARIAVGQAVDVTLDAFPSDEAWTGKVATVNPAEKVVSGVIFYEAKMVFDEEDSRIRSGMTANLDIEIGRVEDAVRLPIRALQETVGRSFVRVLADGKIEERDVAVGLENTDFVEILSGLDVGETVVVGPIK